MGEDEEECTTCAKGGGKGEEVDVGDAVDYLMENKMLLIHWEKVEEDLNGDTQPSPVDCILNNTYVQLNDECLLNASLEVFNVFRDNREEFEKTSNGLTEVYYGLVHTLSQTYVKCSSDFEKKVEEYSKNKSS